MELRYSCFSDIILFLNFLCFHEITSKNFYSFDIETRNEYRFLVSNDSKIKWLDDFILGDFEGERMAIYDFDGMNKQVLSRAISNLPFTLSNDNKYIYSFIQNNSGGYSLNRLKMTIEE